MRRVVAKRLKKQAIKEFEQGKVKSVYRRYKELKYKYKNE